MTKKITSKSTKAEIMEAFEEVKKEKSGLESQIRQLNKEKQAIVQNPIQAVKEKTQHQANTTMNQSQTAQQKMNQTIQSLGLLQLSFGSAASELSEQLTTEATKLAEIQNQVSKEVEELQALHDLEVEENTLDTLVQNYEIRAKAFEEEIGDRRETLEQQIHNLKNAWTKEQETHEREIKERNENQHKQHQRDEEEYQYNLELERNLDIEEYEQNKKTLYKQLEETRQAQEKEWAEREKTIADREQQYGEAKAKVEAHPQQLEANIKNGKENGRNIGNYQAKVAADLRSKEVEGLKRSYELQIGALEVSIKDREERLKTLTKQLEAALKQVQDLAVKAIEGSSSANSYQALKEIAVEQAKNLQKSK